jgi:IS5 family transposase
MVKDRLDKKWLTQNESKYLEGCERRRDDRIKMKIACMRMRTLNPQKSRKRLASPRTYALSRTARGLRSSTIDIQ